MREKARGRGGGSCIVDEGRQQACSGVLAAQASSRTQVSWQLRPQAGLRCPGSQQWHLCFLHTCLCTALHLLGDACSQLLTPLFSPVYPRPCYPTWHGSSLPSSMNSSLSPSVHNLLEITLTAEAAVEHLISLLHWNFMIRFTYVSSSKTISSCRAETMPSAFL